MSLWKKSALSTALPSSQRWNKAPVVSSTHTIFQCHFLIQRNTGENVKPQACSSSKIHRIKDHSGRPFPRWLSGVVLGLLIHGMTLYVYGAKGKQWRTEGSSHWSVRTDCEIHNLSAKHSYYPKLSCINLKLNKLYYSLSVPDHFYSTLLLCIQLKLMCIVVYTHIQHVDRQTHTLVLSHWEKSIQRNQLMFIYIFYILNISIYSYSIIIYIIIYLYINVYI